MSATCLRVPGEMSFVVARDFVNAAYLSRNPCRAWIKAYRVWGAGWSAVIEADCVDDAHRAFVDVLASGGVRVSAVSCQRVGGS